MDARSLGKLVIIGFTSLFLMHLDARQNCIDVDVRKDASETESIAVVRFSNAGSEVVRFVAYAEALEQRGKWSPWPFRMEDGKHDVLPIPRVLAAGQSLEVRFQPSLATLPPKVSGESPAAIKEIEFRVCVQRILDEMTLEQATRCTKGVWLSPMSSKTVDQPA